MSLQIWNDTVSFYAQDSMRGVLLLAVLKASPLAPRNFHQVGAEGPSEHAFGLAEVMT